MVFQSFGLFPWPLVLENLRFGLKALGLPAAKQHLRPVEELLEAHMDLATAEQPLPTAVALGRYAELFAYDDRQQELTFEGL